MFVDFNRVFKGKPQTELKIPEAMVKRLSESLPPGVKYRAIENGKCEIVSEGKGVTIGGVLLAPSEDQKKILGKKFTVQDVLDYSYNAQKSIPLKMKKEGYIILNDEEFPVDRLYYNPYCPVTYVSGEIVMHPQPFPEAFPLEVGCAEYSRELLFKRIPNESVHVALFESECNKPLSVRYFIDEVRDTIQFNISFNLSYAKTIRDIVEATSIYNAFVDGRGLFCGQPIITDVDASKVKKYDSSSILFWEKVLSIEELLNVNFEPPQEDVNFSTMQIVETLYQNLIKKVPIRENDQIDTLDGEWSASNDDMVERFIGKSIYFEFKAMSNMSLFGVELDLPCVIGIFDSILTNYTVKGRKYKFALGNLSEEKHMYTSTMRFVCNDELVRYMEISHKERVLSLQNAKTLQEHLDAFEE